MCPTEPWLLAQTDDPLIGRNATRAAAQLGLRFETTTGDNPARPPAAVVIDLDATPDLKSVGELKERWPLAMIVGVLSQPSPDAWNRAEDAGCDVVTSRGALRKTLVAKLPPWMESPGMRRLRLFPVGDIAGRLGLVMQLADSPLGPLAIFHVGGEILAIEDRCPHAGASLSGGSISLDDGVVTCPEHGSRFDTRTGARVRGPADDPIRTFRVAVDDGTAYVEF